VLKQALTQRQLQRFSPLQIQQIKLLELPASDLEQRVNRELEENPALEEEAREEELPKAAASEAPPAYRLYDGSRTEGGREQPFDGRSSAGFYELLRAQLALRPLSPRQRELGEFLICCLDTDGYLRRPLRDVANDMAFAEGKEVAVPELEEALATVQDFEPAGIGARNLRECLLLQLAAKEEQSAPLRLAAEVLRRAFDDFSGKRYDKVCAALGATEQELAAAVSEITKLNPRPGGGLGEEVGDTAPTVMPDFVVEHRDGELQLSLTTGNAPSLRVSDGYQQLLKSYAGNREAVGFVRRKIDDAQWFIDAIQRRYITLSAVMGAIVARQRAFFTTGDEAALQPMLLRSVAEDTGYDQSTISRTVSGKCVQTAFGVFPLKFFFSESAKTEGGAEVSTRAVKLAIRQLVDEEDKRSPLGDEQLAQRLKAQGYLVARRTVAKYRETMNIPTAQMRKEV
jgi:RNA polymerase sigma-54 factor